MVFAFSNAETSSDNKDFIILGDVTKVRKYIWKFKFVF